MDRQRPGQIVAKRYRLQQHVGSGQMSNVYQAEDIRHGNDPVAVKLLDSTRPDLQLQEVFRRESRALERLKHQNIVTLIESGYWEEGKCFYLVFEWMDTDLSRRPLSELSDERKLHVLQGIGNGLLEAHSHNILHRDIKPSNVLMDYGDVPKIADFGISKIQHELSIGETVSGFWSVGYASPEQQRGAVASEQSDI